MEGPCLKKSCIMQVLLLSEELKLDEIESLLCLLTAHDEVNLMHKTHRPQQLRNFYVHDAFIA